MIDTVHDQPDVIVFPPLIWVATMALAALLQWLAPVGLLARVDPGFRVLIGAAVLLAGVSLAATGRRTLMRLGTNVSPLSPTTALATDGIFGWTRNPLYVGGTLAMPTGNNKAPTIAATAWTLARMLAAASGTTR